MEKNLKEYKKYVSQVLGDLTPVFAKASIGDFSVNVEIPEGDDDFTQLYAGISIMLEVIREQLRKFKEDKRELEVLLNNLPVGVYIAEVPSGKPILTNKKAVELVGREFDPHVGAQEYTKTYEATYHDGKPYPAKEHPIFITIQKGEPAKKDDIVINREDGSKIALKVQTIPVFGENGVMISVIAVFDDITKEKELEKLKTEFVSLASHQLRTPLGTMRWNLEMLLSGDKGKLSSSVLDAVSDVYEDNRKMVDLVNNLLNLARFEQGRVVDNSKPTDVAQVVNDAVSKIRIKADRDSIKINFYVLEDEKIIITIDPNILMEVLLNLLTNAVEYNIKNGKVDIVVGKEGKRIKISIKDTGIGIRKEEKANIFKKFYRTKEAAQKNSDGSGLGLYVVKSYVEAWGGEIDFQSKYLEGSTFNIYIPLKPEKLSIEK